MKTNNVHPFIRIKENTKEDDSQIELQQLINHLQDRN